MCSVDSDPRGVSRLVEPSGGCHALMGGTASYTEDWLRFILGMGMRKLSLTRH